MDDFWGVVWGASIALVASVVGGALTSLAGPALARKAESEERARVSEAERREVVRDAIQEASVAMRRGAVAWIADQEAAKRHLIEQIDVIAITLRLRTTQDEEAVERTLYNAAAQETHKDLIVESIAWERTAASWFRGAVSNEAFDDALEVEVARLTRKSEAIIAARTKPKPDTETETP